MHFLCGCMYSASFSKVGCIWISGWHVAAFIDMLLYHHSSSSHMFIPHQFEVGYIYFSLASLAVHHLRLAYMWSFFLIDACPDHLSCNQTIWKWFLHIVLTGATSCLSLSHHITSHPCKNLIPPHTHHWACFNCLIVICAPSICCQNFSFTWYPCFQFL